MFGFRGAPSDHHGRSKVDEAIAMARHLGGRADHAIRILEPYTKEGDPFRAMARLYELDQESRIHLGPDKDPKR